MKKLILGLALAIPTLGYAQEDSGGLFVEPALTYQSTTSEFNWGSLLGRSDGESEGFGVGARLGFHASEAFFVGGDVRYSMLDFNEESVDYDTDATELNYGPVVGMQMPDLGLRVWGTYVLGGNLDPDRDGSFDVKFDEAEGYRVGVGFRVAAVSLNVEYQALEYGKTKIQELGGGQDVAETSRNRLETESWIGSVSFPVEL